MAMLLQQRQHVTYFWLLKTAIILIITLMACFFPSTSAYGDVFVMNSSLICDACENFCDDSQVSHILTNDCQRGCRIFDTTLNKRVSLFTHFDDTAALISCRHSCLEAYQIEIARNTACCDGCTKAQEKYHKIYSLSLQWLHDVQSNMTFFETLLEVTGSIVFPSAIGVDAGRFVDDDISNRKKISKKRLPENDNNPSPSVSIPNHIYVSKNPVDSSVTRKSVGVPSWVTQSSFALITLGVILIFGVCCYCCVVVHFYRQRREEVVDADLPPSYEQLMRSGFVIVPNNNYSIFKSNKRSPKEGDAFLTVVDNTISESDDRFYDHQQVRRHSHSV